MLKVLVTAGPTIEPIDRVRFISNHSSGSLGYLIARTLRGHGHRVTLISGPTSLPRPRGVEFVTIRTARELHAALRRRIGAADALVMAAAVADFGPRRMREGKIRRKEKFSLKLVGNPDILKSLKAQKRNKVFIGFCVEPGAVLRGARAKLREKSLDMIVGFRASGTAMPFGDVRVPCVIVDKDGRAQALAAQRKQTLARIIVRRLEALCKP